MVSGEASCTLCTAFSYCGRPQTTAEGRLTNDTILAAADRFLYRETYRVYLYKKEEMSTCVFKATIKSL